MKRLFYMMLICISVIVLWGCTENGTEDEPTPPISYLEFSEETDISPEFEADGGTSLVEFTSSHDWTASANQSWITLSRKSGTPQKTYFNITVSKNSSTSKRTGTVTITADNKSYKINVSQQGAEKVVFEFSSDTDTTPEFEAKGGTSKVSFTTSHDWTANANQSWISLSRKSGTTSNSNFTITVSENTSTSQRTGTVTITSNSKSYKVSISQKGKIEDSLNNMECAPNEILYKTKYGYAITLNKESGFGGKLVSNTYENGIGRLTFDADVTAIGAEAFYKSTSLIEIKFPNGIKSIGECAFSSCTSLTSVTIPDSVTSIGEGAFRRCGSLMGIVVSEGNAIYDSRNHCNAIIVTETNTLIAGCGETIIPDSVTSIGEGAFLGCTSLASITIPNSVTWIGRYAFSDCTGELVVDSKVIEKDYESISWDTERADNYWIHDSNFTKLTIGNSIKTIGVLAFANCSSLTSITIPYNVTSIGDRAFKGCTGELIVDSEAALGQYGGGKFTKLTIGNSVTTIGKQAFWGFTSLTSITIPNSVETIGQEAFAYCTSLTSITIPYNVTSIGDRAFIDCTSLASVTIGVGVISIGRQAFYGCEALREVYCKPITPPTASDNMMNYNISGRKIYVPRNSVNKYKSALYWKDYSSDIEGYDFIDIPIY